MSVAAVSRVPSAFRPPVRPAGQGFVEAPSPYAAWLPPAYAGRAPAFAGLPPGTVPYGASVSGAHPTAVPAPPVLAPVPAYSAYAPGYYPGYYPGYGLVYPAGQAAGGPSNAIGIDMYNQYVDAAGNVLDASGNVAGPPGSRPPNAATTGEAPPPQNAPPPPDYPYQGGNYPPPPPSSGGGAPVSPAEQGLINSIAPTIGAIGTDVATVISSGNQVEIQRLRSASDMQIAALNAQAADARARGDVAAAQAADARLQQQQQFQLLLASRQSNPNMPLYIAGGVVVVLLLGGLAFFAGRAPAASGSRR